MKLADFWYRLNESFDRFCTHPRVVRFVVVSSYAVLIFLCFFLAWIFCVGLGIGQGILYQKIS